MITKNNRTTAPNSLHCSDEKRQNPSKCRPDSRGRAWSRAGAGLPKQYRALPGHAAPGQTGQTVLGASIQAFIAHPQISGVQVVIHEDDKELYLNTIKGLETHGKLYDPACGGTERQDSVLAGLEALQAHKPKQVLVHDAARPFVTAELIDRCLIALGSAHGAIPALAVTDTLKPPKRVG